MLIVIGLDGREESLHAARSAALLFPDADYVTVNVIEPLVTVGAYGAAAAMGPAPVLHTPYPGDPSQPTTPSAQAELPGDVEHRQEHGDVARVLLDAAEEHQADLIVVGNHHRGLLERLLHPSTAHALIRSSIDIPILVIPS